MNKTKSATSPSPNLHRTLLIMYDIVLKVTSHLGVEDFIPYLTLGRLFFHQFFIPLAKDSLRCVLTSFVNITSESLRGFMLGNGLTVNQMP